MSKDDSRNSKAQLLRMKAEAELRKREGNAVKPNENLDLRRAVHELQVHQIELEMQNEELRLANDRAETALAKFTMLYDFAPIAYFTLSSSGMILDVNFKGAELLCERRIALMNMNIHLFISEYSQLAFIDFFHDMLEGNGNASCEIKLLRSDNTYSFVWMVGTSVPSGDKCLLSVIDISSRKQADQ